MGRVLVVSLGSRGPAVPQWSPCFLVVRLSLSMRGDDGQIGAVLEIGASSALEYKDEICIFKKSNMHTVQRRAVDSARKHKLLEDLKKKKRKKEKKKKKKKEKRKKEKRQKKKGKKEKKKKNLHRDIYISVLCQV